MNLSLFLLCFFLMFQANAQYPLFIGTYTHKGNSEGIYVYHFNAETGESALKHIAKNVVNPSYLSISPDKNYVYSVNESGKNSAVSAFHFDRAHQQLSTLNQQAAGGEDPCFILSDEQHLILANYSGGSISVFERKADGKIGALQQLIKHNGKSIDPKRQAKAHVHQVQFSPDKKFIFVTDLGEDQLYIYHYQPANPTHILRHAVTYKIRPGSGPRHLTVSPSGRFLYLTHELNGQITVFHYKNGKLSELQEVSTSPEGFKGKIDGADIHISADGQFLYQTNRGDLNTVNVFAILPNGTLKAVETVSTLGKGPRNFCIDPSGNYLLIAHQYTDEVVVFRRNKSTGRLTDSGKRIKVGSPVCLLFSE